MKLAALKYVIDWLCDELLNALLRPVFIRWKRAERAGLACAPTYELRFLRLVDAAPAVGCRIEWGGDLAGLYIGRDSGDDDYYWEQNA